MPATIGNNNSVAGIPSRLYMPKWCAAIGVATSQAVVVARVDSTNADR